MLEDETIHEDLLELLKNVDENKTEKMRKNLQLTKTNERNVFIGRKTGGAFSPQ